MAIQQGTDGGLRELALFAGAGGGILAGHALGWRTVCAVERDAYAAQVLAQRQNTGALRPFPIWADVCSFDGRPWRGLVDVVSGGFPCQDISVAGRGAGIEGARSGMWGHMARIIGEVRPWLVYVENSPALVTRGLGRVLSDLATLGYDCRWTVLGAADIGAPHQRDRFWLVGAYTLCYRRETDHRREPVRDGDGNGEAHAPGWQEQQPRACSECSDVADTNGQSGHQGRPGDAAQEPGRRDADRSGFVADVRHADSSGLAQRQGQRGYDGTQLAAIERADWWAAEPDVGGTSHGLAQGLDIVGADECRM